MDNRVEHRIREAMRLGSERLLMFHGRRRFVAPSPQEVQLYGPRPTGQRLLEVLEQMARSPAQTDAKPLGEEDVAAWRSELSGFWSFANVVEEAVDETTFLHRSSFSPHLRNALELGLCSYPVVGLKLLGVVTQLPLIKAAASRRAWSSAGFYEIYEWLRSAHKDMSLRQEEAIATTSYFAAHVIHLLETYAYVGELGAAQRCLTALQHGAVPLTYDKKTRTVAIANWYTL